MLTKQEKSVLAILAYSAQFEHPLSEGEIKQRMLRPKGFERLDEWMSSGRNMIFSSEILRSLQKKNRIVVSPKKIASKLRYSLFGFEQSFVKLKRALVFQKKKQKLIKEFLKVVKLMPWIKAVAITGSLGAGGGGARDDVDFLIVTKKNRLWLVRLMLLFVSLVRGRRPKLGQDISKSWDLNLWLDEDKLEMSRRRRSVYEAFEILQTNWIYDKEKIEQNFYRANDWAGDFLLNWKKSELVFKPELPKNNIAEKIMSLFNKLAFYLEIGYRTIRHGKQQASLGSAFLHAKNTKGNIFKTWKKLYNQACKL